MGASTAASPDMAAQATAARGAAGPAIPRLRITVLAGGPSAEREVSLDSGRAVAEGLRQRGHAVQLTDIRPEDLSPLATPADVIFSVLHGTWGEDGTLQSIMDERGLVYVGSGPVAAARAMDKWLTKCDATAIGLRTAPAEVWAAGQISNPPPAFGLPLVVKPVDQGSSVATFIVRTAEEFGPAVRTVIERFGRALIEKFIAGREITVGIVGERTLPPIWIQPKRAFYDYAAKYQDDSTDYRFDTGLSEAQTAQLQADSRRLFDKLGCRDLARVDWIVDEAGVAWMLEVNTLPGFTSHSLVPKAAARVGLSFDALCETLASLAWERRR